MADDKSDREAPDRDEADPAVMIYATFPSLAVATSVAEALVTAGLVACANILPGMTSIYIWEGRLEQEAEVAMIMKSRLALADQVVAETRQRHPYSSPAVVVLPIVAGSADYLAWVAAQTKAGDRATA